MSWGELRARLADGRRKATELDGRRKPTAMDRDTPRSYKRQPYEPPARLRRAAAGMPYAELHCHSNFSFLDGASHPEELAEEAARLGLEALAVTDHDGFYGVVRFAEAAKAVDLPTVF